MKNTISNFIFADKRLAWFWLIVRVYLGYEWFMAGFTKLSNPAWMGSEAGKSITGFVNGALTKTQGAHPDVQMWYASFLEGFVLPNATFFSYLVVFGEILVGVGLILGLFTFISAFFGAFMNMNYLLAGTVSSNPVLLLLAILVMLAHKVAGWWGLDRYRRGYRR